MEGDDINIYQNDNENVILSRTSDVQYQLLEVQGIGYLEDEYTMRVKLPNGLKGMISPIDSILLVPKARQQVIINSSATLKNKLNDHLNIDYDNLERNRVKMVYSDQYVIFNNQIYESLVLVDEVIGFIKQDDLSRMHPERLEFQVIKDTTLHKDRNLNKPFKLLKASNKTYRSSYFMPSINHIRFKYKGAIVWINCKDTNFKSQVIEKKFNDTNELILDSILYQYKLQLENYHQYYNEIIDKEMRDD